MKIKGRILREYIYYPWHFNGNKPFRMTFLDGTDVTMEKVFPDKEYEIVCEGESIYDKSTPFTRYTVREAL